jgi:putative ABC transport system permease protein
MTDLRIALRMLRKNPSYALVAVLTLAIAIGATTAIFSVLNAVVLRPLPYRDSDRLVLIRDSSPPRLPEFSVSPGRFLEWQKRARSFETMAAIQNDTANLTGVGEPVRMRGAKVSATAFPMLGIGPIVGRTFTADEDHPGADGEVILSEGTWRARFAGDRNIVGQTIRLDDKPMAVIGVMPASFQFPNALVEYWRPMGFTVDEQTRYGSHYLAVVARLKPGVTVESAGADLARAAREIESLPGNKTWTTLVFSYLGYTVRGVRSGLLVLSGAVAVVLLIACANVANLLLARGLGRERELAVRAALGASRRRLVRQMLSENLVLGIIGSLGGLALAAGLLRVVTTSSSLVLPRLQTIRLDGSTVTFAVALAALTPLLFGLLPAVQISRTRLRDVLAQGGRSGAQALRGRTRALLIVAEVALAVVLVAGSTLLVRSFARLTAVATGFDSAHSLLVPLSLPTSRYLDDNRSDQFWTTLLDRLSTAPGVEAVAITQSVPFVSDFVTSFEIAGITPTDQALSPNANFYAVSPAYFRAMGIPLLRGRGIGPTDIAGAQRVVVISKSLADRYFANIDPIGQRLTLHQGPGTDPSEIIGVAGDIKQYGLDAATTLQVYEPARQHRYFSAFTIVARSAAQPEALTGSIREVLHGLDPALPVATARTLSSYVDSSTGPQRFTTMLLGGFAGVALLLAAIGVYGLVSFAVAQRTQEIGIRMALGARSSAVLGLVLRQGLGLTAIGVGLGAVGTVWTTHLLQAQLFEASTRDSATAIGLAPVALLLAAALACYVPARRALRVPPSTALRQV